jgi:branched-chain amino acid transport system permease protein
MEAAGLLAFLVFFLSNVGFYAVLALGLNVQWGMTGQINIGVAGFFAVGAYASAILTTGESVNHLGGFGLPFWVGFLGAMGISALVGWLIGAITVNLRSDYLAIATIGIAETIRLILKNEDWLTNGVRGISNIPRPLVDGGIVSNWIFLGVTVITVGLVFLAVERARISPWGRVLRAIRDNEDAVQAAGKDIIRFRLQAFIVGAMFMGLAGALYAHFLGFISPSAFEPVFGTFIVWAMLIAGGSGNNKGALVGALAIWVIWSLSETFLGIVAPGLQSQGAWRTLLVGVLVVLILMTRPQGILPEERPRPRRPAGETQPAE